MLPILLHSEDISEAARGRLLAAHVSTNADEKTDHLERAASLLFHELSLDCADVRELVGLPAGAC